MTIATLIPCGLHAWYYLVHENALQFRVWRSICGLPPRARRQMSIGKKETLFSFGRSIVYNIKSPSHKAKTADFSRDPNWSQGRCCSKLMFFRISSLRWGELAKTLLMLRFKALDYIGQLEIEIDIGSRHGEQDRRWLRSAWLWRLRHGDIANLCLLFSNPRKGRLHYIRPVGRSVSTLIFLLLYNRLEQKKDKDQNSNKRFPLFTWCSLFQ